MGRIIRVDGDYNEKVFSSEAAANKIILIFFSKKKKIGALSE